MRFVLDASVALAWLLSDENPALEAYAHRVLALVDAEVAQSVIPMAWHAEVAHVLLKRLRSKRLSVERFNDALALYQRMPLESHMNAYTVGILIERARRYHAQAIDTLYLDLASTLSLPIATIDSGLRSAAKANGVKLFAPA